MRFTKPRTRRRRRLELPSVSGALLVAFVLLAGCRDKPKWADVGSRVATTPSVSASAVPTTGGKTPCPATGQWSDCAVFDRLDHAGLAPRRDSSAGRVKVAPLTAAGSRILLGSSELDVFVYPDAKAREADEKRLDHSKFIEASDEPTLRGELTLIRNVNLLAVLHSRNDHQRERVSDALTAGPPSASAPAHP